VRGEDLRARRQAGVVGPGHVQCVTAQARDAEARDAREVQEKRIAVGEGLHGLDEGMHQPLCLALDEDVDEGLERRRIGEGERPTGHHQRVLRGALRGQDRQPGQGQHAEEARQLQLVGHREGQHRECGDGRLGLEGEEWRPALPEGVHVLGEKGTLGCGVGMGVDFPVDGLKPEAAHPHVVGARVQEGHPQARHLVQGALLRGEQPCGGVQKLAGIQQEKAITTKAPRGPKSGGAPGCFRTLRRYCGVRYGNVVADGLAKKQSPDWLGPALVLSAMELLFFAPPPQAPVWRMKGEPPLGTPSPHPKPSR
jgi:hypothetical protein